MYCLTQPIRRPPLDKPTLQLVLVSEISRYKMLQCKVIIQLEHQACTILEVNVLLSLLIILAISI